MDFLHSWLASGGQMKGYLCEWQACAHSISGRPILHGDLPRATSKWASKWFLEVHILVFHIFCLFPNWEFYTCTTVLYKRYILSRGPLWHNEVAKSFAFITCPWCLELYIWPDETCGHLPSNIIISIQLFAPYPSYCLRYTHVPWTSFCAELS